MVKYIFRSRPKFSVIVASTEGVIERWMSQYPEGRWPDKDKITKALVALPATASVADMDKIIGNRSWTSCYCASCGDYKDIAVEFDNGDHGCIVCEQCLDAAKSALSSGNGERGGAK